MMVKLSTQNVFLVLVLSFAITCNMGVCMLKATCHEKDKHTLLCFKQGLIDPSGLLSSWTTHNDCCQWMGVQCDLATGRVSNLTLPCSTDDSIYGINKNKRHCLTGELHLSILQLEFLSYLDLSNNNFQSIHLGMDCHQNFSLANSSNLVYLDLSHNENLVIDDLRWILHLSSLEYLNLDFVDLHNQTQWLQTLTQLPSLAELHLASCLLESASPSLDYANYTSLEYLDLSGNGFFSELPNWLFNLSGLSVLRLGENRFHGKIPRTLLNLRNLNTLRLNDNELSGNVPNWLGQIGSLQYLYLFSNFLTGPIPATIGNLSSLKRFDVYSNHLNGTLPKSLGNLSNLESLGVGENPLSGIVSNQNFAKLSELQRLWLGSPSLILDFDHHWVPPFQLQVLVLAYVDLKLLPWLYTQTFLERLTIDDSTLPQESQDKFWSWTSDLDFLSLSSNSMNWDMSNVLLNPRLIWLVDNGLRGSLPQLTTNVEVFVIPSNNLSGTLSPLLCHKMNGKSNLQFLALYGNSLSGGLTECWENWKSLIYIDIGNNNLTGTIPHSMSKLSNLSSLDLSYNKLHGEIPRSLQNCKKLMVLNLAENQFSGSIPNWIGHNMKALQLRSNQFSNAIPPQICHLSALIVLDVASNKLSGTIPHCMNNITAMVFDTASMGKVFGFIDVKIFVFRLPLFIKGNELHYRMYMKVVDLSNNHLSGKIPLEIFTLTALQYLNLSQNQLWGTIPEQIGNMKQLQYLDFSDNKFSGEIPQSMAALTFLSFLNLSFNNFKGKIPSGTQLQGFDALSYIGNPELCGAPLRKNCTQSEAPNKTTLMGEDDEKESELMKWFYMGMGIGFAISFWLVCGSLFFIRAWRHAYFRFIDDVKDKLYVKMVLLCTPSIEI